MSPKKAIEDAQVGDSIGPHRYRLTEELARFAASNVGLEEFEVDVSGSPIAPSCVTDNDYALAWMKQFTAREAVHTKAEHHYLSPPIIGEDLVVTGSVTDRYNKRGKDFLVFETVTHDGDGREIVRSRNTLLIDL